MADWIKNHEAVAYGYLGLKPWEFGEMTVGEFLVMVEEKRKNEQLYIELAQHRTASLLAAIYNTIPSEKPRKALTAADFLPKKQNTEQTPEEMGVFLRSITEMMGGTIESAGSTEESAMVMNQFALALAAATTDEEREQIRQQIEKVVS